MAAHDVMKKMVISEHASAFAVNRNYQGIKRLESACQGGES